MKLRTQVGGVAYRLRSATFSVTPLGAPTQVATVSTEDDPDATSAQRTLAAGGYAIALAPGWRLEKQLATGFQTVSTQLVSENPLPFSIASGQTTPVAFAFQADGTAVVLGDGSLSITIQVTDTSMTSGTTGIWDAPSSLWGTALWL